MKIIVDKMPKEAKECIFCRRQYNLVKEEMVDFCTIIPTKTPCYLTGNKECPFLKAGEQE